MSTPEDRYASTLSALHSAQAEIATAREACPSVRMQDNFDAPLLTLINLEVSRGFNRDAECARLAAEIATTDTFPLFRRSPMIRRFVYLWLFALVLLVGVPGWASAQTTTPAIITQFQLLILPTTGDPLTVAPITSTTTTIGPTQNCGIDPATIPAPPATKVNPLLYTMDDPFTAGKKCRLSFPTTLATGTYQWAGVFIAPTCTDVAGTVQKNCVSPRGVGLPPFSVANLVTTPAAPSGLALLP